MDFKYILTIITSRFRGLFGTVAQFLSPSRWKGYAQGWFSRFLTKLTDLKPKDQTDYYNVLAWQISKKVAYLIVVIVGVLSAVFVFNMAASQWSVGSGDGLKTYRYTSLLLKFCDDTVKIKGRSGYIAYVGDVSDGACNGDGSLYRKDGSLVYKGNFASSMFEGDGASYYPNGNKEYEGEFSKNLFNGTGTLYRKNSSIEYTGNFVNGLKDGTGTLYNNGGGAIYTGTFSKDHLVYSELLGGTSEEAASHYTGKYDVYSMGDDFCVHMKEINAAYIGTNNEDSLDDSATVSAVYVLSPIFYYGDSTITNIAELKEVLDMPTYEGNAYVNLGEAVCINSLNQSKGEALNGPVDMDSTSELDGYTEVSSFDDSYLIYLYVYEKDGLVYSFVAPDKGSEFEFYYIQALDATDDSEEISSTEDSSSGE